MTPGPTEVPKRVRKAMSRPIKNPDLQNEFLNFYMSLTEKLSRVYETSNDIVILSGEGILGLETSVASLIEKNDKALCISNGFYGDGFADFVKTSHGKPVMCTSHYGQPISIEEIKTRLENHEFEIATMVHCETPTGTLNRLGKILSLLNEREIITIVDAVSSLGGVHVPTDKIDVCIGASQKCFSSPPGLTTLSVSDEAWQKIEEKEQDGFYTSLAPWKDKGLNRKPYFPYTQPVSNLYALNESLSMILEEGLENVMTRHEKVAEVCRKRGNEIGLSLYPNEDLSSPTVTAFKTEEALKIQEKLFKNHKILLATSIGKLKNKILRVGHMGNNAKLQKMNKTLNRLEKIISTTCK